MFLTHHCSIQSFQIIFSPRTFHSMNLSLCGPFIALSLLFHEPFTRKPFHFVNISFCEPFITRTLHSSNLSFLSFSLPEPSNFHSVSNNFPAFLTPTFMHGNPSMHDCPVQALMSRPSSAVPSINS
jgi:hypothetical protein